MPSYLDNLRSNMVQQVTPVVNLGNMNADGTVGNGPAQSSLVTNVLVTSTATSVTIPAGGSAFVQNWNNAVVYVKCGAGASASDATYLLAAGASANDGTGGSVLIENYTGMITFFSSG